MRILLLAALLIPAGLAEGTQIEDEMGTPNINTIVEWVRTEYPDLPRIQTTNCRKIAGSSSWSQHSWANAADIFVSKAVGDELAPRLRAEFGEHIKTLLWQVNDHFDHIHVDTWPTGTGTPPCGGGTLQVRHKDGTTGTQFTDDIEQGGDDLAILTDAEQRELQDFLNYIRQAGSNVGFVTQAIQDIRERNDLGPWATAGHTHPAPPAASLKRGDTVKLT